MLTDKYNMVPGVKIINAHVEINITFLTPTTQ
jgi:hypothetical protein